MTHDDYATSETRARLLPVKNAADAAKRLGLRSVIVLQELPDGRWGYTSYGDTRANCRRARQIADAALATAERVAE